MITSMMVGAPPRGGGKSHKHGSGPSKSSKKSSSLFQEAASLPPRPRSFLFVVNELNVNYEPLRGRDRTLTDQWFNVIPPEETEAYIGEVPGTVFRYLDGVISPAYGYKWYRPQMGFEGRIVRLDRDRRINGYPEVYRSSTVFACSPMLPMIVVEGDASLGYSFVRRICPCDRRYSDNHTPWAYLHFGAGDGVSYARSGACGDPWVAGQNPSWVPSLVPAAYKNTDPSAPPSQGLAGELGIVVALMGFHGKPGQVSDVFRERKWNLNQWVGSNRASNYLPKSGDSPRGLFVQICADNLIDGQPDSSETNIPPEIYTEILRELECNILVHG